MSCEPCKGKNKPSIEDDDVTVVFGKRDGFPNPNMEKDSTMAEEKTRKSKPKGLPVPEKKKECALQIADPAEKTYTLFIRFSFKNDLDKGNDNAQKGNILNIPDNNTFKKMVLNEKSFLDRQNKLQATMVLENVVALFEKASIFRVTQQSNVELLTVAIDITIFPYIFLGRKSLLYLV
jgi:hypothetical protein